MKSTRDGVVNSQVILEEENQSKNLEVVHIPSGSISPSISSIQEDRHCHKNTCPGIYKKGVCLPLSELPSVIYSELPPAICDIAPLNASDPLYSCKLIPKTSNPNAILLEDPPEIVPKMSGKNALCEPLPK